MNINNIIEYTRLEISYEIQILFCRISIVRDKQLNKQTLVLYFTVQFNSEEDNQSYF